MRSRVVEQVGRPQRADRSAPTFLSFCLVAAIVVLSLTIADLVGSRYVGEPLPHPGLVGP